jgi:hypothetical protein
VISILDFKKSGFNQEEWQKLKKLSSPKKIQDFLNSLPFNFERGGETHRSVSETLKAGKAHCFEGALVAAVALWMSGQEPLLLDLATVRHDFDHVVTLFKQDGYWGAISKTNHSVLRYREPVYKNVRELAMSYFHEYFLNDGQKTLRSFSKPFNLKKVSINWLTSKENLADLAHLLDKSPHTKILSLRQIKNLRKADRTERQTTKTTEWKR